ncbi:MAG TPA: hypothetical protein VFX43_04345 [Chitinophagaceae bacterium]|jgi:hypothetical protein|nr:hypothetical protein [Chitinophagaceae bacterium]
MGNNNEGSEQWDKVETMLKERFGKTPDLQAILFLIGIQELGQPNRKFTKEQKQDLMHIAVCTLLSRSGYYQLDGYDKDGWPHFTELMKVTGMDLKEQEDFLKQHVIAYFEENGNLIDIDTTHANH